MNEWIDELSDLTATGEPAVLVTVAGIRGSAPREVGAKMIVTRTATIGTIGGGQLEYQCAHIAAGMLDDREEPVQRKFPLGASMGQCCGGVVEILFEPIADRLPGWLKDLRALHGQREPAVVVTRLAGATAKFVVTADAVYHLPADGVPDEVVSDAREGLEFVRTVHRRDDWFYETIVGTNFNIAVFGAGHVGTAVVQSLANLDCNIRWIDSRRNIFRQVPGNVRTIETGEPALEVAAMPPGSCYLVMTHSHALDFEICDRILNRRDATYCGLIGSTTKRRRFETRYRAQGMPPDVLGQLVCPIGIDGISGKKPAEIAVAAAADVLRAHERAMAQKNGDIPDFGGKIHQLRRRR